MAASILQYADSSSLRQDMYEFPVATTSPRRGAGVGVASYNKCKKLKTDVHIVSNLFVESMGVNTLYTTAIRAL